MGILDKAKAVTETAAQHATGLKEHAKGVASGVADKATALGEHTAGLADDLRTRAGELSDGIADAAMERARAVLGELNAALPLLRRAGYTINDVSVELGLPPKVVAGFTLAEKISDEQIATMLEENAEAKLASMLLRALVNAQKLQSAVNVGGLRPKGIALQIGLPPSVVVSFGR